MSGAAWEYSVCLFFADGTYEYDLTFVSAARAAEQFAAMTTGVAAQTGLVRRVIITDGGDCINAEWEYGKGITFGGPEAIR